MCVAGIKSNRIINITINSQINIQNQKQRIFSTVLTDQIKGRTNQLQIQNRSETNAIFLPPPATYHLQPTQHTI